MEEVPVYDLIVRGGRHFDGTGGPPRPGDVAIQDGVIVAVGPAASDPTPSEIDAESAIVTPVALGEAMAEAGAGGLFQIIPLGGFPAGPGLSREERLADTAW